MFEMKLGGKFAELTADLGKLRKREATNKARILNPFASRYEEDAKKWLNDLESFLVNDFKPPETSYLSFAISSKEKIRKEGQEYQDELNELTDFLYHNGDKSDKLLAEFAKEREIISKRESFYFQQIKNTPDKLIKSYLVEIIKVIELSKKSYKIAKSVGDFYQYLKTPELLKLSSFSSQLERLSKNISSLVDDFVKKIDKKYQINLQINSFLKSIRHDEWSSKYSYAIKKREEVQKILNNFANETAQDIEKSLLSYEVLINLLPEFLSDTGGWLKIFLTKKWEEEIKAKIESITNLEQAKETYREIAQYLHDLRQLAKDHIELVDKELQNAKKILGEDITNQLPKPEEDFVKNSSSLALENFTKKILGEVKDIVGSREVDSLDIAHRDNSEEDQFATENKQTQIKYLEEKLIEAEKAKHQLSILKENLDRENSKIKREIAEKEEMLKIFLKDKDKPQREREKNKGLDELNQKLVETNEEKKKKGKKIWDLVTKLRAIQNDFKALKAKKNEKEIEFQKITKKIWKVSNTLKFEEQQLANEREKITIQNGEIEFLENQISQLRTKLVSLRDDNFSLSTEKNLLESQLSNLQKEKENLVKNYDKLIVENNQYKEEKKLLEENFKKLEDRCDISRRWYDDLLVQRNSLKVRLESIIDDWKEKYSQEKQSNENLSRKITIFEDDLAQAQSDFQREREKVDGYETKLKTELVISDVTNWESAINSLKSRPEQAALDASNAKLTIYENGLQTIFSKETIVKDGVVTKVIPTTFEPSEVMLNVATWVNNIFDKLNNSQLKSELKQAKQELYGYKSKLIKQKKEILQKFIDQLELKLEGEEITSTKIIQKIKELLGKTPGQETSLRSENEGRENQIINLNKILSVANSQKDELKNKLTKINKENIYLTDQNSELKSQLSQKEKEKLLGIILGVESGVVLTFVILSLMFKKKIKKRTMLK